MRELICRRVIKHEKRFPPAKKTRKGVFLMSNSFISEVDDLEFEDESHDIEITFPNEQNDFGDAVIWGTDWTLETISQQIAKGNIDLNPHFQRRDAWDVSKKSKLVESFIIGMPVPPIILAEKKNEKGKYMVIDGKQRLLAICQFCIGNTRFETLRIKNLAILKNLNSKTYVDLDGDLAEYKDMFDNQSLRTVVIKNWPHEQFLYSIFLRLNTGRMVNLSTQELRQALHPGDFLAFLDSSTAESLQFHRLLKNDKADSRMRDIDLALRSYAWKFYFEHYKADFKSFLDETCNKLNTYWATNESDIRYYFEQIEAAIDFTYEVFGDSAFSKPNASRYAFNRALYDIFIYYFSIEDVRASLQNGLKDEFVSAFSSLYENDKHFAQYISSSFKNMKNVAYRFEKMYELINSITNVRIPRIELEKEGFIVQ